MANFYDDFADMYHLIFEDWDASLEHRKPSHVDGETNKFVFDCGVLLPEQQMFTLQPDEIDAAVFKPMSEALNLVSQVMRRRLEAIQRGILYYELP